MPVLGKTQHCAVYFPKVKQQRDFKILPLSVQGK